MWKRTRDLNPGDRVMLSLDEREPEYHVVEFVIRCGHVHLRLVKLTDRSDTFAIGADHEFRCIVT